MSTLTAAMPTIFLHEGGYSTDPIDSGGATNYGISLRFLLSTGDLDHDSFPDGDINHDGKIDIVDIKSITPKAATKLYDAYWWSRYDYENIDSQMIATKLLDLAVNMGQIAAVKILQRSVNHVSMLRLPVDGIMGPRSFRAVNEANNKLLFHQTKIEAAKTYTAIVKNKPDMIKYFNGWMNRAYSNPVL